MNNKNGPKKPMDGKTINPVGEEKLGDKKRIPIAVSAEIKE